MKAYCKLFIIVIIELIILHHPVFAQWTDPIPVVEINTTYRDKAPFLTYDGLTLYFSRQDGPGWHYTRLYQATRPEPFGIFTSVQEISNLNSYFGHVDYAWVSPDNLRMYYYRTEDAIRRLKFTERTSILEPWKPGINISEINNYGDVANPSLTQDELSIFFAGNNLHDGLGEFDICMATRPDRRQRFKNITILREINSSSSDLHPSISPNGLTLYFDSTRNGTSQLFKATRESLNAQFDNLEHLSFFDSLGSSVHYPSPSKDGTAFYFVRRSNNSGMTDIYVSYISETETYFVDAINGDDSHNGLSLETAFATIQNGIESSENGDTILIYPGTYNEQINFMGKAIIVQGVATSAGIPIIENPEDVAVLFYHNERTDSILKNLIIKNSSTAIFIAGSSPTISNVTIIDNKYGIESYLNSEPNIINSIIWNNIDVDLHQCQAQYCCIKRTNHGEGNIYTEPLFADPENGDYHLRSEQGRHWPDEDIWILDNITSPCIDGGDTHADYSNEPMPNGGCINMGAYGGTAYASKSKMPDTNDVNNDNITISSDINKTE